MPDLLTKLPHRFISITGDDSEKFLQGQVSCDLSLLQHDQASFGTINTPKGRMYCLFKVVKIENGFLLCMEHSITDFTIKQLSKYKVFFKCELKEETQLIAYGVFNPSEDNMASGTSADSEPKNTLEFPQQPMQVFRNDSQFVFRLPGDQALYELWSDKVIGDYSGKASPSSDSELVEQWHALETSQGLPELYEASQEKFILQNLNLQSLGAVSFKKGCYTGQEIIARMKFLGKQKKKMFLLHSTQEQISQANADLFDKSGQKCGVVVRSHCSARTGSVSLGILSLSYSDNNEAVFLDSSSEIPFEVSELIYDDSVAS